MGTFRVGQIGIIIHLNSAFIFCDRIEIKIDTEYTDNITYKDIFCLRSYYYSAILQDLHLLLSLCV